MEEKTTSFNLQLLFQLNFDFENYKGLPTFKLKAITKENMFNNTLKKKCFPSFLWKRKTRKTFFFSKRKTRKNMFNNI